MGHEAMDVRVQIHQKKHSKKSEKETSEDRQDSKVEGGEGER